MKLTCGCGAVNDIYHLRRKLLLRGRQSGKQKLKIFQKYFRSEHRLADP